MTCIRIGISKSTVQLLSIWNQQCNVRPKTRTPSCYSLELFSRRFQITCQKTFKSQLSTIIRSIRAFVPSLADVQWSKHPLLRLFYCLPPSNLRRAPISQKSLMKWNRLSLDLNRGVLKWATLVPWRRNPGTQPASAAVLCFLQLVCLKEDVSRYYGFAHASPLDAVIECIVSLGEGEHAASHDKWCPTEVRGRTRGTNSGRR